MATTTPILLEDILAAGQIGETDDWEFKAARGGVPGSLWETYSAMANTIGGKIVLGVTEKNGRFQLDGLDDPKTKDFRKQIFDNLNNRSKVSVNLLKSDDVQDVLVDGRRVLVLTIPPATRHQKPVYIGPNPLGHTFRRQHEGDYRCADDEVRRMLADADTIPADHRVLPLFTFDDIHVESLSQYRNIFSARQPDHAWLDLELPKFLEMLGGIGVDRDTGKTGLTAAGLLMFGAAGAITDTYAYPKFWLDYQEYLDANERWSDRVFPDGTWEANLFQFYRKVLPRLTGDLPKPFGLEDGVRIDDTPAHKGLREAFVNALVHTDYRAPGNILIARHRDKFVLENPGTLLVSYEQLRRGSVSECRNPLLQRMFVMIGGGERAGSGYQTIQKGWRAAGWRSPHFQTQFQPDRVLLTLPRVSLIPADTLEALRARFGKRIDGLPEPQLLMLATALIEDGVSNARMQELLIDHPTEITRHLTALRDQDFLQGDDRRRWTIYQLATPAPDLFQNREARVPSTSVLAGTTSVLEGTTSVLPVETEELQRIAQEVSGKGKVDRQVMERVILALCAEEFLTLQELATLLNRKPQNLRNAYLTPMTRENRLQLRYPKQARHPHQGYKAATR